MFMKCEQYQLKQSLQYVTPRLSSRSLTMSMCLDLSLPRNGKVKLS